MNWAQQCQGLSENFWEKKLGPNKSPVDSHVDRSIQVKPALNWFDDVVKTGSSILRKVSNFTKNPVSKIKCHCKCHYKLTNIPTYCKIPHKINLILTYVKSMPYLLPFTTARIMLPLITFGVIRFYYA